MKTKCNIVHDIKNVLKSHKLESYAFPVGTTFKFWDYCIKKDTTVINMFIKGGVLYITTYTEESGTAIEKVSDFDVEEIKEIYDFIEIV